IKSAPAPAAPISKNSFEKSPLRKNEITKNVIKNIAAVPKSPIMPRHPIQNIEKPKNSVKFFFS
ncbi:hypothetical protein RF031_17620, partial [Acinetobacter baumannii]|nr:hypothetical protein [Acinetobacter baumannii]